MKEFVNSNSIDIAFNIVLHEVFHEYVFSIYRRHVNYTNLFVDFW